MKKKLLFMLKEVTWRAGFHEAIKPTRLAAMLMDGGLAIHQDPIKSLFKSYILIAHLLAVNALAPLAHSRVKSRALNVTDYIFIFLSFFLVYRLVQLKRKATKVGGGESVTHRSRSRNRNKITTRRDDGSCRCVFLAIGHVLFAGRQCQTGRKKETADS